MTFTAQTRDDMDGNDGKEMGLTERPYVCRARHTAKPRGWGSMAYPTALGSRRVQFMLRTSDVATLKTRIRLWGCSSRAEVVRESLRRATCLRDEATVRPIVSEYIRTAKEGRKGQPALVRWSQWMRPQDFENAFRLNGWMGLGNLAEVVRFAIRAAAVVDTPPPSPKRMPKSRGQVDVIET